MQALLVGKSGQCLNELKLQVTETHSSYCILGGYWVIVNPSTVKTFKELDLAQEGGSTSCVFLTSLRRGPYFSLYSQALPFPWEHDHPTSLGAHISLVPGPAWAVPRLLPLLTSYGES